MDKNNKFLFELFELIKSEKETLTNLIDDFYSLSPDNKNLTERIHIKTINNLYTDKPTKTLNIKGYELSRIANEFENIESMPNELKDNFPDLTTDDWDAFRRLITLIFCSLEIEKNENKSK